MQNPEARMRRALGLGDQPSTPERQSRPVTQQERRPRRFVRDGEVPVVMVKRGGEEAEPHGAAERRARAAELALEAERQVREQLERRLREAREALQSLQTKQAHAELTHGEALAAERRAREAAERALEEALVARDVAQQELTALREAPAGAPKPRRGRATAPPVAVVAAFEDEGEGEGEDGPEPVKWWLPSYRSRKQR